MAKRQNDTVDTLVEKVEAVFDAANVPRAKWEGNNVVQDGVRIMVFGNGIEIDYVDPPIGSQHKAHIDRLLVILNDQFHEKDVELNGKVFQLDVQRKTGYITNIHIYMHWVSGP